MSRITKHHPVPASGRRDYLLGLGVAVTSPTSLHMSSSTSFARRYWQGVGERDTGTGSLLPLHKFCPICNRLATIRNPVTR